MADHIDRAYSATRHQTDNNDPCLGIDADTLHLCGGHADSSCKVCGDPVCVNHPVKLFGLPGDYCFGCAVAELDLEEAADELLEREAA